MAENKVGKFIGGTLGTAAGAGLIGMLDGPSPILDIVGGNLGGAIGGAIGGKLPGGKKRMAGDFLQIGGGPKIPRNVIESTPQGQALIKAIELNQLTGGPVSYNPNTQMGGMGIADPNRHQVPSFLQNYVKY